MGTATGAATTSGVATSAGRVREDNEDRWLIRAERGFTLLGVADGVGGEAGGEVASSAALDFSSERFFRAPSRHGLETLLADVAREANDAVIERARAQGVPRAACTLVLVATAGTHAAIANLGDSRAYLLRAGDVRQLTTDHAGDRPGSISRFLGDAEGAQPDVFVESLHSGDRLVLCSDGLVRHVSDREIAEVATGPDVQRAADTLVGMANDRGGEDNVTVIVHHVTARWRLVPTLLGALAILAAAVAIVILAWRTPAF